VAGSCAVVVALTGPADGQRAAAVTVSVVATGASVPAAVRSSSPSPSSPAAPDSSPSDDDGGAGSADPGLVLTLDGDQAREVRLDATAVPDGGGALRVLVVLDGAPQPPVDLVLPDCAAVAPPTTAPPTTAPPTTALPLTGATAPPPAAAAPDACATRFRPRARAARATPRLSPIRRPRPDRRRRAAPTPPPRLSRQGSPAPSDTSSPSAAADASGSPSPSAGPPTEAFASPTATSGTAAGGGPVETGPATGGHPPAPSVGTAGGGAPGGGYGVTGYLGVSVLPVALPVAGAATAVPAPVIAPGAGDGGAPVPAVTVPPFTALLPQPPASGHGPQDVSTLSFSAGATAGAADPVAELAPAGLVLLAIVSSPLSGRRRVR
jgi:hypothetical protein